MRFAGPRLSLMHKMQDGDPKLFLQMCHFVCEGLEITSEDVIMVRIRIGFVVVCAVCAGCLCVVDVIDLLVVRQGFGHDSYSNVSVSEDLLSSVCFSIESYPSLAAVRWDAGFHQGQCCV